MQQWQVAILVVFIRSKAKRQIQALELVEMTVRNHIKKRCKQEFVVRLSNTQPQCPE